MLTQRVYSRKYRGQQAFVVVFSWTRDSKNSQHTVHQRLRPWNDLIEAVTESAVQNPQESYRFSVEPLRNSFGWSINLL